MRQPRLTCLNRIALLAIAGLGVAAFATIKISPQPKPQPQPFSAQDVSASKPLISGFSLTEYDSGNKAFTINAEKMFLRKKKVRPFGFRVALGKSAQMDDVEIIFYKDNQAVSNLASQKATIDIAKKDIIFDGKPIMMTQDKRMLGADKITWNNSTKQLFAQGRCFLAAEGKIYNGKTINSDVELKNFTMEATR